MGLIPEWGRSPGAGNGNPLQYSCLENSTDRGAWQTTVHWVTKSDTNEHTLTHTEKERLSNLTNVPQDISGRVRTEIQVF